MKKILLSFIIAATALCTAAQSFDEYFTGNTLRLDYVFAGDRKSQAIYVDQLSETPGWYGRRHNLDSLPLEGNGQITVSDARSGKVIYRHSFSTLFQEWLATEESKSTPKSFENVFLVPFPKDSAYITVDLFDYHQKVFATMTHKLRPDDILIRKISWSTPTRCSTQPRTPPTASTSPLWPRDIRMTRCRPSSRTHVWR